jgi:hypothetical protein
VPNYRRTPKSSRPLKKLGRSGEGVYAGVGDVLEGVKNRSIWTSDSEFFDPRLQCRTFHSQPDGSAFRTAHNPCGFSQSANDVFSLGMLQSRNTIGSLPWSCKGTFNRPLNSAKGI